MTKNANKRASPRFTALERIIEDHFGTQTVAAKALGITPQAVSDMVRKGKRVPAEWCIPLESATEGKVTRHELRPDIYPDRKADA